MAEPLNLVHAKISTLKVYKIFLQLSCGENPADIEKYPRN